MISNERPSPYSRLRAQNRFSAAKAWPGRQPAKPKRLIPEMIITEESVQIERKQIVMRLKENGAGRFLRITETNGVRFSSIIIPANGLEAFQKCVASVIEASQNIPSKSDEPVI